MDENIRIKIEYLIAHKNNLWTGLIVLIGGLAGILLTADYSLSVFSLNSMVRIFLFLLGAIFVPFIISGLININSEIKNLLK